MCYSTAFPHMYKLYSQALKITRNRDKALELLSESVQAKNSFSEDNITISQGILMYFNHELNGDIPHLYVENDSLLEFLENNEFKDIDGVMAYAKEHGYSTSNNGIDYYYFIINLPNREKSLLVELLWEEGGNIKLLITDEQFFKSFDFKTWKKENPKMFNLCMNTIVYMRAFPEYIKNGLPKGLRLQHSFKNKKLTIRIADKIRQPKGSPVPHLRRGHFRYYPVDSEFFVNMRGKTIFIEATIVNGKNKDIKTLESGENI